MVSPFRTVFIFIILGILGGFSIPYLSIDLFPKEASDRLKVQVALPGHPPELVESMVTQALENAFSGLPGLKSLNSVSYYDRADIELIYNKGRDLDLARFELAAMLRRVFPGLPAGASYPEILAHGGNTDAVNRFEAPFLIYSIRAPAQPFSIRNEADKLFRKEFAGVPGLKEVKITGTEDLQLVIRYDLKQCGAYGISPGEILNAVGKQYRVSYPGVYTDQDGSAYFLKVGRAETGLSGLENLILPAGDQSIKLRDIAEVFIEEQPVQGHYRVNGQNSVNLMFFAQEGSNRILLAREIREKMASMADLLPSGYRADLVKDETVFLSEELNKNYKRSLAALAVLIVFLILGYRSWRHLVILILTLVINLALTALACRILSIPVHLYSIAGLAISFGIMIDNSILTLDYFHQYRSRHVFLAVLGATLTTVAALLFVFLLPEEMKRNLVDFSAMVSIALVVSLAVSLWFTPGLYQLFYPESRQADRRSGMEGTGLSGVTLFYFNSIRLLARFRKTFLVSVVLMFGLPLFMLPSSWPGKEWYNKTIGNTWYQEHLRPTIDRITGGALRLFVREVYERSGYRDPQRTRLYISAQLGPGNTLDQLNVILSQFEIYLKEVEGIDRYVTSIISGQYGFIEISFLPEFEHGILPWRLKSQLTSKATDWSAVEWGIFGVGQGFSTMRQDQIPLFRVLMKGYNNRELEHQAQLLKERLLAHPRIQKVNTNERLNWNEKASLEYLLTLDEQAMAAGRMDKQSLFSSLRNLSQPISTGQVIELGDKSYPLVMREAGTQEYDLWDLKNKALQGDTARAFKLGKLSGLALVPTASAVHKEDRQYIRLVAFEYLGSEYFGSKYLDQVLVEMKSLLPPGYEASRKRGRWGYGSQAKPYGILLLIILANFFICALLFEHLVLPFYIILMIPVSFTGLFLTFAWGDFYFDQGGYAAFVMLTGLVVNAAIFIVHDYQQAVKQNPGLPGNSLLILVIANRSRTILLTTIAAASSLLPFIWEGQNEVFWFSLAVGVLGGLSFSMFAVFIALPVLIWNHSESFPK
ncbi:MAG TPA: efflux RND transporter permease subunit [Saprospiraceae bacterium]|nr:efflux RND transporter permease subunit [Saprospiraceae bacterium]HNT21471.1 efflux RND transporter permease subunit [Saprospiraceae bacterium]